MEYYILKDLSTGNVDAVIEAENSTSKEIEKAIQLVKDEKNGAWDMEDIREGLPSDCQMFVLLNDLKEIWY